MERLRECLSRPSSISLLEISGRGHATPVDVAFEEILYAQCFNHVIDVHTLSGVYRTRMSFQDFSARFPHTGRFYICGRGLVVNLSLVAQVEGHVLLLKNGDKLPVPPQPEKGSAAGLHELDVHPCPERGLGVRAAWEDGALSPSVRV